MSNKEMLSFYDEELNEIGTALRSEVHSKGLLHQVVHCWIVDKVCQEKWIYFQQRSYEKKDFPGLYDISAAGHVDIGEEAEVAVKRETQEEIGIVINPKKLKFIGSLREEMQIDNFFNNEICNVYLYSIDNPKFKLGHEVEKMVKVSFRDFKKWILEGTENIVALSIDGKSKIVINSHDFCPHKNEYLKFVFEFMDNCY